MEFALSFPGADQDVVLEVLEASNGDVNLAITSLQAMGMRYEPARKKEAEAHLEDPLSSLALRFPQVEIGLVAGVLEASSGNREQAIELLKSMGCVPDTSNAEAPSTASSPTTAASSNAAASSSTAAASSSWASIAATAPSPPNHLNGAASLSAFAPAFASAATTSSRTRLLLLVGIPGSGKSTFAKKLCAAQRGWVSAGAPGGGWFPVPVPGSRVPANLLAAKPAKSQ